MDCPAEEQLVRLALAEVPGIARLSFDLPQRRLTVWHTADAQGVAARLGALGLGARLDESADRPAPEAELVPEESGALRTVLAINAAMFVVEVVAGWLAQSTGLLADSLDMLADAAVYALALRAAGRAAGWQRRAAHASGWLQLCLALLALAEVARRATGGGEPEARAMVAVSLLALLANVASLVIVARRRHAGVHMRASVIFSANDVLANLGVLLAGALVAWTGSRLPDLVVGSVISLVVLSGAVRILRLR